MVSLKNYGFLGFFEALEQLTGVNGDLELEEEKESILFLDLPWREEAEDWRLGVQGLVTVVSWW